MSTASKFSAAAAKAPIWAACALSLLTLFCFLGLILQNVSSAPAGPFPVPSIGVPFQLYGDGFAPNAVFASTPSTNVPRGVRIYGSWLGSDAAIGSVVTSWLKPVAAFSILVAGYPTKPHMALTAEVEYLSGAKTTLSFADGDPREAWQQINVTIPADRAIKRFRIRASDGSKDLGGWLGFSQPFTAACGPSVHGSGIPRQVLLFSGTLLSLASAIVCFPKNDVARRRPE